MVTAAVIAAPLAVPPAAQAAVTDPVVVTVNGADVAAAAQNRNGLTFKGFGVLTANSTSALLLDYKAQHPEKYWDAAKQDAPSIPAPPDQSAKLGAGARVALSGTFGEMGLAVLTGLGRLNVCTRYRGAEEATFEHYPYHQTVMHQAVGDYEQLAGWDEDITECRDERELPPAARDYLQFISDFVGVPIALIGVGPGRDQVIWTEAGRTSLAAQAAALA